MLEECSQKQDASSIIIALLYHTGMRISEVLGLTWSDIDFDRAVIYVGHQVHYVKGALAWDLPKTPTSNRQVFLDQQIIALLNAWRIKQKIIEKQHPCAIKNYLSNSRIISCSPEFRPANATEVHFICTQRNGKLFRYFSLSTMLRKHGLNAHSFRHTHATLLYESGASPKGVAARLGHANTNLTENLYTHVTEKMQHETVEIFEKEMQTTSDCRQHTDK